MVKINRSKDNQFYFILTSPRNGQTILTSETYTKKSKCIEGIHIAIRLFFGYALIVNDQSYLNTATVPEGRKHYVLYSDGTKISVKSDFKSETNDRLIFLRHSRANFTRKPKS